MNRIGKIAVCCVSGLAFSATLRADQPGMAAATGGNPYTAIVERNVFGLLPPPTPPDPNAAAQADLPKITANGIMNVFGNLKVLFKTASGKPGTPDNYYDLAEGQSEDDIDVVRIDEKAGLVTFNNHGTQQQIALATQTSTGGGGGGPAGGFHGGGPGFSGGNNGGRFGNRFPTSGGYSGGYAGGYAGGNNSGGNNGFNSGVNNGNSANGGINGGISIGNTSLNFNGQGSQNRIINPSAGFPQMTPEEQAIAIYGNTHQMIQQADPAAPIMPPTVIDDMVNGSSSGNQDNSGPSAP